MEIKKFVGFTSPAYQSTGRNFTGRDSVKLILLLVKLTQWSGENINN
jgi:hypothetical protein